MGSVSVSRAGGECRSKSQGRSQQSAVRLRATTVELIGEYMKSEGLPTAFVLTRVAAVLRTDFLVDHEVVCEYLNLLALKIRSIRKQNPMRESQDNSDF